MRSKRSTRTPSPASRRDGERTFRIWPLCIPVALLLIGTSHLRFSAFFQRPELLGNVKNEPFKAKPIEYKKEDLILPPIHSNSSNANPQYDLAFRESMGFFDDYPNHLWERRKQITHGRKHNRNPYAPLATTHHAPTWYQENHDPDFACAFEDYLGLEGDGHKWVCDPHRIEEVSKRRREQGREGCLVYSVGSNGAFDFETDLQKLSPSCEIHVFDMDNFRFKIPPGLNISYHQWGIRPTDKRSAIPRSFAFHSPYIPGQGELVWEKQGYEDRFKTFQQTVKELGHEGRVLDVFKIDCEGCEWFTYKDWLSGVIDVRQILVEVHDTPPIVNNFFNDLHAANFVMFHKEPNIQYAGGACVEFSFLKLHESFFANASQYEPQLEKSDFEDYNENMDDEMRPRWIS